MDSVIAPSPVVLVSVRLVLHLCCSEVFLVEDCSYCQQQHTRRRSDRLGGQATEEDSKEADTRQVKYKLFLKIIFCFTGKCLYRGCWNTNRQIKWKTRPRVCHMDLQPKLSKRAVTGDTHSIDQLQVYIPSPQYMCITGKRHPASTSKQLKCPQSPLLF